MSKLSKKKKILLSIVGLILGLLVALYLFAVVYTNFIDPPKSIDGRLISSQKSIVVP